MEHEVCVLIFSTALSETFLILRRIEWDIIINVHSLHVSICYLCQIFIKFEFEPQGIWRHVFWSSADLPVPRYQPNYTVRKLLARDCLRRTA
jgi:hypothetical protein